MISLRLLGIRLLAVFLVIVICFSVTATAVPADNLSGVPYEDVTDSLWSYPYIQELYGRKILPDEAYFYPMRNESRGSFVSCLYAMHLALGGEKERGKDAPFSDVSVESVFRTAVLWAKNNQIVNGISETEFGPDQSLTREHICTILTRYASVFGVKLPKNEEPRQFRDSLAVSSYARTPIVACQMSGIVNGYTTGYFHPQSPISRQECAETAKG